ncbi:MAG: acyl-CoA dehydrogenase family protein, partial [Acidimicrobiaceae bacterium]|nr:acyl-CoA dehydrogenase family protein [Acidimicrobiaceae bacterium]
MAIDFTLSPEHEAIRGRVREFINEVVKPATAEIEGHGDGPALEGKQRVERLISLRKQAHKQGLWLPHMPVEWGGMGLGHVALAMVQ